MYAQQEGAIGEREVGIYVNSEIILGKERMRLLCATADRTYRTGQTDQYGKNEEKRQNQVASQNMINIRVNRKQTYS